MPDQNPLTSSSSPSPPSTSQQTTTTAAAAPPPPAQPIPPPPISKPPFQSQVLPTTPTAYNSSTTPTTSTPTSNALTPEEEYARYERFKRRTAWACLVLSPTIALLPPRKLDLYTLGLTGMFVVSASHLALNSEMAKQAAATTNANANASGNARRWWWQGQKRQQQQQQQQTSTPFASLSTGKEERNKDGHVTAAAMSPSRAVAAAATEEKRIETWKERRMREEREAFAQGKGYGDLIMDQIREVVGWDKTGAEGGKQRTREQERREE